jgi:NAD(P)-dependent dehydrogenase (short-subunit alcohol dehydrogenase family)
MNSSISDMMSLKGRRALITGANGHLGRVMAEVLASLGAHLILIDHYNTSFSELLLKLQKYSQSDIVTMKCDLGDENDRGVLINYLLENNLALNIIVNNAAFVGTSDLEGWNAPFHNQSLSSWRKAIEVNLTAPFHLVQGLQKLLENSAGANVINIGSIYGQLGPNWDLYEDLEMSNPAAYSASKGGLIQLTRWLATTLAPSIRVNAISPGGIKRMQDPIFVNRYQCRTPLKRMAKEKDLIGALIFLATDLGSYVTGQCINVDGGFGAW